MTAALCELALASSKFNMKTSGSFLKSLGIYGARPVMGDLHC
jgi:hypothetical protein